MFDYIVRIVVAILLSLVMYLPSYAMVDENAETFTCSYDLYNTETGEYLGEATNIRHIPEGWYIDYYPENSQLYVTREFSAYEIVLVGPEGRVDHETFSEYPFGHSYAVADNM